MVTPANAFSTAASGLATHAAGAGEAGKGEVTNAATWDEFPNGRFGDVNSPAFGSQDLWGGFSRSVLDLSSVLHRNSAQTRYSALNRLSNGYIHGPSRTSLLSVYVSFPQKSLLGLSLPRLSHQNLNLFYHT